MAHPYENMTGFEIDLARSTKRKQRVQELFDKTFPPETRHEIYLALLSKLEEDLSGFDGPSVSVDRYLREIPVGYERAVIQHLADDLMLKHRPGGLRFYYIASSDSVGVSTYDPGEDRP